MMNDLKTGLLLAALTGLLLILGNIIAGRTGVMFAFIFALILNGGAYWFSDKIVLNMYKATPLPASSPVYQIITKLAHTAQTPMPKVYLVESEVPNAFATGRNPEHAAIAVTSGLLSRLNEEELTGVLAHEMSHILHRDTLISVIAATLAGTISSLANMAMWSSTASRSDDSKPNMLVGLAGSLLAPMAAGLVQMAVSRTREFEADVGGANLTKKPLALASALEKLEQANQSTSFQQAESHPGTAHLFIVNPLRSEQLNALFATHPSTKERIKRLKALAGGIN